MLKEAEEEAMKRKQQKVREVEEQIGDMADYKDQMDDSLMDTSQFIPVSNNSLPGSSKDVTKIDFLCEPLKKVAEQWDSKFFVFHFSQILLITEILYIHNSIQWLRNYNFFLF